MNPRAAFQEYYRQFRKARKQARGAFIQEHAIFVRNRRRMPVGYMTIYFMRDDSGDALIVLDRTVRDD
jgi:hypothetical protein